MQHVQHNSGTISFTFLLLTQSFEGDSLITGAVLESCHVISNNNQDMQQWDITVSSEIRECNYKLVGSNNVGRNN